jgi:(1->4)-alpha-D-glucan 1-alpha-D-glucosylmutase
MVRRAALLGALNSLVQLTLKATMPGVPDFYQGTELWDLSLVDPDNRRPFHFAPRRAMLPELGDDPDWTALAQDWQSGRIKFALTRKLLAIRNRFGETFTQGSYRPLAVTGPQADEIVAFARSSGRDAIIVVIGRWFGRATDHGRSWPSPHTVPEASVKVDGFSSLQPLLVASAPMPPGVLPVSQLFRHLPAAILHAQSTKTVRSAR